MSTTQRTVALFCLGFALLAPTVTGSPGPSQHIIVTNESSVQVGVTTDATNPSILSAIAAQSTSQFTAAGGVFLNPSASHTFSVQAGTYTIGASNWSVAATGIAITQVTFSQTVAANHDVNVYVHGNTSPVVLTIDNTP